MDNALFLNEFEALSKLLGPPADEEPDPARPAPGGAAPASIGPKELLDVTVPKPRGERPIVPPAS
jgi:hypothetical protein